MAKNSKKTNSNVKTVDPETTTFAAALAEAGVGASGVAVMATVNTKQGVSPEIATFKSLMSVGLTELAVKVIDLHDSATQDLDLMAHYQGILDAWADLNRQFDAAKVAYEMEAKPLIDQLEADREKAKSFPTWLTFEKSEEISKTLSVLKNPKTYEQFVPELVAKREAMVPDHNEALEFMRHNEDRRAERKAAQTKLNGAVKS